jgi:hypothetical protein
MLEAVIQDLEASIFSTEYEIDLIKRPLALISGDPYYFAVQGKYMEGLTDEEIARQMDCEATTVWRNRKRLVQRIAVYFFGLS